MWAKLTKKGEGNEISARLYEIALIFTKKRVEYTRDVDDLELANCAITNYDEEGEADLWDNHPNHKPYSSISPLIRNYSKSTEAVLDPFCGSGSTAACCIKLKRKIFGIELSEHWSNITRERGLWTFNDIGS